MEFEDVGSLRRAQAPFLFGPAGKVRARLPAKPMNSVFEREPRAEKRKVAARQSRGLYFSHLYQFSCVQSGKMNCYVGEEINSEFFQEG